MPSTRAVDQGLVIDVARISDVVRKALDSGQLSIKHAQGGTRGDCRAGAPERFHRREHRRRLSLLGSLDLIDGALDATRLVGQIRADARPDIFMA